MAEGLDEEKMKDLSREGWEFIYKVIHSFTGHHKKLNNIKMRMSNGDLAQTDTLNVEILQPHFNKTFNGMSRPLDMEKSLSMVKQWPTHQELDQRISMSKLNEYIRGASNKKTPGESQIPAEALKAPSHDTKKMLLELLQDFFDGQRTSPEEWNTSILKYYQKRGPTWPNKLERHFPQRHEA
jgi:hypothetical protein